MISYAPIEHLKVASRLCPSRLYIYSWLLSITESNINSFLPQDTLVVSLFCHTLPTTYANSVKCIYYLSHRRLRRSFARLSTPIFSNKPPIPNSPTPFQRKHTPYPTKMRATSALTLLGTGFSAVTTATSFGVPGTNALNLRYAVSHHQFPPRP